MPNEHNQHDAERAQAEKERMWAMTPEERLQEMLRLRIEKYGTDDANGRVQRVMRVIDLEDK